MQARRLTEKACLEQVRKFLVTTGLMQAIRGLTEKASAHTKWFDLVDADTGFDLDTILIVFSKNGIGHNEQEAAVRLGSPLERSVHTTLSSDG
jgi:hypothetical protein